VKVHIRTKNNPCIIEYTNFDGDDIPITDHTELLIRWGGERFDDGQLRVVMTIQEWRELNLIVEQAVTELPDTRAAKRKARADSEQLKKTIADTRAKLAEVRK